MSPWPSEHELSEKAAAHCREHAARSIRGEVRIEVVESKLEWDELSLRDVFHQAMTIWRRYERFEVIVDAEGLVAGFVDHHQYERALEGSLTEEEAEAIVAGAKLVPPGSRLVELEEHHVDPVTRTYRATVELRHRTPAYGYVEVEINPTTRAVIAVRPLPGWVESS